ADFFDMETYPNFTFKSGKFRVGDKKLDGELTIKNITKPISLDVEFQENSNKANPASNPKLLINDKVNRQDFGLTGNGKNEAGEIIVGDDIKLQAKVSFIKVPALVEI